MSGKGSWRAGFETVSNFRMYYRDWRPAGGEANPPVIALHGSICQSGMWIGAAEGVARARFVCPDLRGFGRSEDPADGDAAADFARDALGLANALMIGRFTIMGHSFASAIALWVAAMAPERVAAAVLVDPTVRRSGQTKQNLEAMRDRPYAFDSPREAAAFWRKSEEGQNPQAGVARFIRDVMMGGADGGPCRTPFSKERLLRLRTLQASAASDYDPVKRAASVRCPVLVFRGGASRRFPAGAEAGLRRAFPNGARTVLCPKSGHFPTVSEPALFQRELKKFLAGTK